MRDLWKEAQDMQDELSYLRQKLHQMPEIGLDLPRTCGFVTQYLKDLGIDPKPTGKSGVSACIGKKTSGKVFLLRADMDALPMPEYSGLDFASKEPSEHTCGHDMHAAMLLGAAKILKNCEDELPGMVKLMFQPGEETMQGALSLIEAGILENPHVDAAMGLHVIPGSLHVGTVACSPGPVLASSDVFTINITGKAGHGAFPQNSIDAINIASHIVIALQTVQAREQNTQEPLVLSICSINGGNMANSFPATVSMGGTIRAFCEKTREYAKMRLTEICEDTAKMFKGHASVVFHHEIPAVVNHAKLSKELMGYVKKGKVKMQALPKQMGSEDFAAIAKKIPSVFFNIGAGGKEEIYNRAACHDPKVVYNEDVLKIGTAIYASCAYWWLKNNCNA